MKKESLKKIILAIIITLSVAATWLYVNPKNVATDSGFDVSYDGGFDGGYDGGFSSNDGLIFGVFEMPLEIFEFLPFPFDYIASIVFIAVFIITLVKIVSKIDNKIKKKSRRKAYLKLQEKTSKSDMPVYNELIKVLPDFDMEKFKSERYYDFCDIQKAWSNFDYNTLRGKVTDELYNQYKMQLDTLKSKSEVNKVFGFEKNWIVLKSCNIKEDQVEVVVELTARFYDFIEKDGKIIRGDNARKVNMVYELTFIKSLKSKVNYCPNCGYKLDSCNSNKCPACGSIVTNPNSNWILSKKQVLKQR